MGSAKRLGFCLTFTSMLLAAPSTRGQDAGFWSFLPAGRLITRCVESTPAYRQARSQLERLDTRIQALRNVDSPAGVVGELHDLLRSDCFLPAAETDRVPKPDTALSMKEWWENEGGFEWLDSFLELPELGPIEHLIPHVVVPADARKTLDLDSHREHPLRMLLCPVADTACGAETRGWQLRADADFETHRALGRNSGPTVDDRQARGTPETSEQCAATVASGEAGQRYQRWRDCVERARPRRVAMPLGEFKAPTTGWIVITGRRGHYEFCDTARAYSLTTGTGFIYDSCSNLALRPGGDVDFDVTNRARLDRVAVGTIPVGNLREAIWMILFRGEAAEVQLKAAYYPLPTGLVPRVTARAEEAEIFIDGGWVNTGQTSLTWRWMPTAGLAFVGELTWPDSYDAAESHAASLLAVAEAAFVQRRCAQGTLPDPSIFSSTTPRHLNELAADALSRHDRDFKRASDKWRALPICPSAAR